MQTALLREFESSVSEIKKKKKKKVGDGEIADTHTYDL